MKNQIEHFVDVLHYQAKAVGACLSVRTAQPFFYLGLHTAPATF
jgi:hypothetical protein